MWAFTQPDTDTAALRYSIVQYSTVLYNIKYTCIVNTKANVKVNSKALIAFKEEL